MRKAHCDNCQGIIDEIVDHPFFDLNFNWVEARAKTRAMGTYNKLQRFEGLDFCGLDCLMTWLQETFDNFPSEIQKDPDHE